VPFGLGLLAFGVLIALLAFGVFIALLAFGVFLAFLAGRLVRVRVRVRG
jgi:hypothetical protein